MFRYRAAQKHYHADVAKATKCPFCHIEEAGPIIRETALFRITKAKYTYDLWEFRDVVEHLLIVPKRHVSTLAQLSQDERKELIDIMAEYEAQNYNVYARAIKSVQRTETHQHTHLIKTSDKHAKAAFFMKKPYFVAKV